MKWKVGKSISVSRNKFSQGLEASNSHVPESGCEVGRKLEFVVNDNRGSFEARMRRAWDVRLRALTVYFVPLGRQILCFLLPSHF